MKEKEKVIRESANRLDWQDREIDRLLGLLKQNKLHLHVESTSNLDVDNWKLTDKQI